MLRFFYDGGSEPTSFSRAQGPVVPDTTGYRLILSKRRNGFGIDLRGEPIEAPSDCKAQAALQAFLPPERDAAQQQVSAESRRRVGPVQVAPFGPQLADRAVLQIRQGCVEPVAGIGRLARILASRCRAHALASPAMR